MAATYRAIATGVTWSTSAKCMLKVFNASGSGVVLRVYRVWVLNNQTANVTGVIPIVQLVRTSTVGTGGTVITPIKHDTSSSALPAQVTAMSGDTSIGTIDATFRRSIFSSDEPAVGTMTIDELESIVPLSVFWDTGYIDTGVEPITLREGYGVMVYCAGIASAAGNVDVIIEFTSAGS